MQPVVGVEQVVHGRPYVAYAQQAGCTRRTHTISILKSSSFWQVYRLPQFELRSVLSHGFLGEEAALQPRPRPCISNRGLAARPLRANTSPIA